MHLQTISVSKKKCMTRSIAWCKRDVTPWLTQWSYISFALSHRDYLCGGIAVKNYGSIWFSVRQPSRRWCLWRLFLWANFLPQSHSNGFSPEWVRKCLISSVFPAKLASHCVHWWRGFSSLVCWFRCLLRWSFDIKDSPQTVHLYGLSPVWVRRCILRKELLLYLLSQILHP